jgi:hypothetical protein
MKAYSTICLTTKLSKSGEYPWYRDTMANSKPTSTIPKLFTILLAGDLNKEVEQDSIVGE